MSVKTIRTDDRGFTIYCDTIEEADIIEGTLMILLELKSITYFSRNITFFDVLTEEV